MSLPQHLTPKPSTLCSNASLPPREVVVDSRSSCRTASAPFVWRILSSYLMAHALSKRVRTNNSWPNAARIPNCTASRQPPIDNSVVEYFWREDRPVSQRSHKRVESQGHHCPNQNVHLCGVPG